MSTGRIFVLALAFVCVASWTFSAWAADTPAAPGKAAPSAKAKPKTEIKCVVTGKLEEKTVTNKKGKEVKAFELVVASAKGEDGKALPDLAGKTLRVGHTKDLKLAPFAGKEVTITGTLINNKQLKPESIK